VTVASWRSLRTAVFRGSSRRALLYGRILRWALFPAARTSSAIRRYRQKTLVEVGRVDFADQVLRRGRCGAVGAELAERDHHRRFDRIDGDRPSFRQEQRTQAVAHFVLDAR